MNSNSLPWRHKPFPELVRLAWPISVSVLSYSAMTLVDTLFVGRLGAQQLAGVSVGGVLSFALLCFGFGALRSVKVLVSQAIGAGNRHRIANYLGAGLLIAALLGVANVVLGQLAAGHLHRVMATAESAAHAAAYVSARVWGAPCALGAIVLKEMLYGTGDAKTPMRVALVANVANIALDYLFIFELEMGVAGAGWASACAPLLSIVLLALARRRDFGLDRNGVASIRAVWRMGVPLGLQMLLEVGAFLFLTFLFAAMSVQDVAAHQIALQVIHFSFLPAFALGEAVSVLVGQAVGANEDGVVRTLARQTLALGAVYTGACGILFAVFGRLIVSAFTDDAGIIDKAVTLLVVAAIFQVADAANIIARSVLRGTGDVRYPAVIAVIAAWVCTPPLAVGLGYGLALGALGGWIGLCIEIFAGAVILWWRVERGGWLAAAERSRVEQAVDSIPRAPDSAPRRASDKMAA